MVDEDEYCATEDWSQWFALLFPVPDGVRIIKLNSIPNKVDYRADIHKEKHYYACPCWENLQILRVLNVTKAESYAQGAED